MMALSFICVLLLGLVMILCGRRQAAPALFGKQLSRTLPAYAGSTFTLGLYNIHRARGSDGIKDLARIGKIIGETDVIGLCECEGMPLWGGSNQCLQLGEQLQLGALFSPVQKRWGRYDRGNGLLTRMPVTQWYQEPLVDSSGTHPRCLLRADLQIGDLSVPLFVTHLSRRIDQAIQLETVMTRFAQYERALLVGDLNLTGDDRPLKDFLAKEAYVDAIVASGIADDPERIDWIISKGFNILGGGNYPVGPSDHPYYWVELQI